MCKEYISLNCSLSGCDDVKLGTHKKRRERIRCLCLQVTRVYRSVCLFTSTSIHPSVHLIRCNSYVCLRLGPYLSIYLFDEADRGRRITKTQNMNEAHIFSNVRVDILYCGISYQQQQPYHHQYYNCHTAAAATTTNTITTSQ
jgi:hypothetical protein